MGLSLRSKSRRRAFLPTQVSAVTAWLRLQASTQSAGEFTNWAEIIGGNNAAANSARRPSVAADASGLPIASFDGAHDVTAWPVNTANNGTSALGYWFRVKPTSVALSNQYIAACDNATGGASVRKWLLQITAGGVVRVVVFMSQFVLASFDSASGVLVAGASAPVGFTYDNSGSGNSGKLKVFAGTAYLSGTYGGGATLGVLPTATGNILIGDEQDSASAVSPFGGSYGPNVYALNRHLTDTELAKLEAFDRTS
jgi:hypothetical protein